jgi:hypothetical protein
MRDARSRFIPSACGEQELDLDHLLLNARHNK